MTPEFKFALREDLKYDPRFLPTKAHENDTGWDVACAETNGVTVKPGEFVKIRLGIRMFVPEGWWMEIRPRSSSFIKKNLLALYGVIDEGFENEMCFLAKYNPYHASKLTHLNERSESNDLHIEFGERIGQLVPVKRRNMLVTSVTNEEMDKLFKDRSGTRGTGGFGSSG